jgi:hypothetical protein
MVVPYADLQSWRTKRADRKTSDDSADEDPDDDPGAGVPS